MSRRKQRQHYVPKFYLRNFSSDEKGKHIGVFNLNNTLFISNAPLKTQAYKPFFYGEDGEIEEALSRIESNIAPLIQNIASSKAIPRFNSNEWFQLLEFTVLMSLRNPVASTNVLESSSQLRNQVNEMMGEKLIDDEMGFTKELDAVYVNLKYLQMFASFCSDLKLKILWNRTNIPFITSDNPLIKYNQYLEKRKWPFSTTGYGSVGLQLLLPISPKIILLFYDDVVYKVGNRKNAYLEIFQTTTVDSLNFLQFLNCNSQVFFNHELSEIYIKKLFSKAIKWQKPNQPKTELLPATIQINNEKLDDYFIRQSSTEAKIKLEVEGILVTKKGKRKLPSNSIVQMRPNAERLMNQFNLNRITKYSLPQK